MAEFLTINTMIGLGCDLFKCPSKPCNVRQHWSSWIKFSLHSFDYSYLLWSEGRWFLSWRQPKNLLMDTGGERGRQAEGGLSGLVGPHVSWSSGQVAGGQSVNSRQSKNLGVGGIRGGYGEGLSKRSWFPFLKRGTGRCALIIGISHCSPSSWKFIPGCWKGGAGW